MRLIITFDGNGCSLPVNYRHLIQGWIYASLPENGYSTFLHDYGYEQDGKKFKLFVFSDLLGKYQVKNKIISFESDVTLEIASQSPEFIEFLYRRLTQEQKIVLGKTDFFVRSLRIQNDYVFQGEKTVLLETISPVTAYRYSTKFDYFAPNQPEFEQICFQNLERKAHLINPAQDKNLLFQIEKISRHSKRMAYFKNTFYVSYMFQFKAKVNAFALNLLLNTGMSSKSSAGFGMLTVISFERFLHI